MKKVTAFLLFLGMIVSLLAACSGGGDPTATSEGSSTAETAVSTTGESSKAAVDGDIVLTMMDIGVESEAMWVPTLEAIERFEADNPGVTIQREAIPSETYLLQIPALAASDSLPDIVNVNGSMTRSFAQSQAIISLQPYVDADAAWKDKVYSSAWSEHLYQGEIYAQPEAEGNYGYMVYNTAIFEEAGVEKFPETLSELHEACEKIKAAGYTPIALGDSELWPADSINFSSFLNNFVGNDWTTAIFDKTGEASFTDQPFIDALAAYQDIATKGYFNDNLISISNSDALSLYMNGQAAMKGWGDWEEPLLVEQAPEIAEVSKVAAWPAPDEGAKATKSYEASSAWGFAIGSSIQEASIPYAVDFISNYICSDEWAKYMIEEKFQLSPWTMPEFDESKLSDLTLDRMAFKENATPCLNMDAVLDATVKDVYQRGLQSLLIGEIKPEQLATDVQNEYEMVL